MGPVWLKEEKCHAGCLTGNRAVYARLLPGGHYIVLCEFCLHKVNSEMRARLPVLLAR